jgi:hypothetical protein
VIPQRNELSDETIPSPPSDFAEFRRAVRHSGLRLRLGRVQATLTRIAREHLQARRLWSSASHFSYRIGSGFTCTHRRCLKPPNHDWFFAPRRRGPGLGLSGAMPGRCSSVIASNLSRSTYVMGKSRLTPNTSAVVCFTRSCVSSSKILGKCRRLSRHRS